MNNDNNNIITLAIDNTKKTDLQHWLEMQGPAALEGKFDLTEMWKVVNFNQNNSGNLAFLIKSNIIRKGEYERRQDAFFKIEKLTSSLGFAPESAEDFVLQYIERHKVEIDAANNILDKSLQIRMDGKSYSPDDLSSDEGAKYVKAYRTGSENLVDFADRLYILSDTNDLGYAQTLVRTCVNQWAKEAFRERIARLVVRLNYSEYAKNESDKIWTVLENACFVNLPCKGFAVAILKSFIWQVKRKALGTHPTNEIMPVITGIQEVGKTSFINDYFLKPISDFSVPADFAQITDNRNLTLWNNLAIVCDEMSYFSKSDIDVIKNKITSKTVGGRPMGTNSYVNVVNRATFIGTANQSLAELVYDETGVRRFAELEWSKHAPQTAFPVIQEITKSDQWTLLWQSVDENGPNPTFAIKAHLTKQQRDNTPQSAIAQWIADDFCNGLFTHKSFVSSQDAFNNFYDWHYQNKISNKSWTVGAFGKQLSRELRNGDYGLENQTFNNVRGYSATII